jgi:hypothetical protein
VALRDVPYVVHGLGPDGEPTAAVLGGAYDEASAVSIAIAMSRAFQREVPVVQEGNGEVRAWLGVPDG